MLLQGLHRLGDIPCVPELHLAVISAAGEVILLVGVEVEVTYQLPVSILYAVYLAGGRMAHGKREWAVEPPHFSRTPTEPQLKEELVHVPTGSQAEGNPAWVPRLGHFLPLQK